MLLNRKYHLSLTDELTCKYDNKRENADILIGCMHWRLEDGISFDWKDV